MDRGENKHWIIWKQGIKISVIITIRKRQHLLSVSTGRLKKSAFCVKILVKEAEEHRESCIGKNWTEGL